MSPQLTSRSADLQKLRDEGYEVSVIGGHLVVSHIPYVTVARQVAYGSLVSTLNVQDDVTTTPDTHVAYFTGETPCTAAGAPLDALINSAYVTELAPNVHVDFMFSHKPMPSGQYPDYHEKITTYAAILMQQAHLIDPAVTAQTFAPVTEEDDASVFTYLDTASTRAGIAAISAKLAIGPVGIVGLGGTGAYILDLLAKTPITELHLFDGDTFQQHNAFRAPGAATLEQLRTSPYKVNYLAAQYAPMRSGIIAHPVHVDAANLDVLEGVQFVFLAIDDGPAKEVVITFLEAAGIAFIDVGMGIYDNGGALGGLVRTTLSRNDPASRAAARSRISFGDNTDNAYTQNIQIADLNALNAALAVIRFKKTLGFYLDFDPTDAATYMIDSNVIANEDPE